MSDPRDRLIESAVRPFSDNAEMKAAAEFWLKETIQGDDSRLEEALKRWEAVDRKADGRVWKFTFCGVVALVSLFAWIACTEDTLDHLRCGLHANALDFGRSPDAKERVFPKLTESQKLLFPETGPGHTATNAKERLWTSEPGNPAYFAEYVRAFTRENGHTPPGFLETARKIAADNSWFTYFAADRESSGAVTQNADQSWKIVDQNRLDRVITLLRQARGQAEFESYNAVMLTERLNALPRRNLPGHMDGITLLANAQTASSAYFLQVHSILCAHSWTVAEAGNVAEFREISKDAEHYLTGMSASRVETLLNEVIQFGTAVVISGQLSSDAEKLGLTDESARWRDIHTRLKENRKGRSKRSFLIDGRVADPLEYDSVLTGSTLAVGTASTRFPPRLSNADLKPARMLDHAFLARMSSHATWLVMALGLGAVSLYRFRVGLMPRGLARRAVDLLDRRDWAWIAAAGGLLPLIYVLAINHLTPLGGHDSGLRSTALLLPVGQFVGLWLLWFTVPVEIVRWRLGKRAGPLGFPKPSWFGWVGAGAATAFVPMIGFAAISRSFGDSWKAWLANSNFEIIESNQPPTLFLIAVGLAVVPMLCVLIHALAAVFTRPGRMIARVALSMVLTQVFAGALLLAAVAIPAFRLYGQYWFDRDQIMKADPTMPGWTNYESKVAHQAREELREALGHAE